jgi:hypothetical protein
MNGDAVYNKLIANVAIAVLVKSLRFPRKYAPIFWAFPQLLPILTAIKHVQ